MDDMMSSIAGLAMDMKAAQFAQNYNVSLTRKIMDTQEEVAAQMVEQMLPPEAAIVPQVPKGEFLDVYA